MAEPAAKKLKGAGSYDCAYKEEWADSYPVGPVNGSKGAFYCIPCKKSLSCTHQGLGDVKQHCDGKSHQKNAADIAQSGKITFTKPLMMISKYAVKFYTQILQFSTIFLS